MTLPAGTPGPATMSGTWMSVSNAVCLPIRQTVLAKVVAVVGAEEDVCLVGEVLSCEGRFGVGEQLVDGFHGLRALAVALVGRGDLRSGQGRTLAQPCRRVDVVGIERWVARLGETGEVVGVAGRRGIRLVRSERRGLDQERRGGVLLDERLCFRVDHVDAVVVLAAVKLKGAVVVLPVVELGVSGAVGDVPVGPAGRDRKVRARRGRPVLLVAFDFRAGVSPGVAVTVEVLAQHRGCVATRLERDCERSFPEVFGLELLVPAVRREVGHDVGVVRDTGR